MLNLFLKNSPSLRCESEGVPTAHVSMQTICHKFDTHTVAHLNKQMKTDLRQRETQSYTHISPVCADRSCLIRLPKSENFRSQ